jgi:hypothetical protein
MEVKFEVLRNCLLCEGIADVDLARMVASLTPVEIPRGGCLWRFRNRMSHPDEH